MSKIIQNDYIHFLQRILIQKAYFIWNETQSWETTFNQVHVLLEYLYDILYLREDTPISPYELEAFHQEIASGEAIYPYQTFDEYVISLTKMSDQPLDYANVLSNLDDPVYKSNLLCKYQKHCEISGLKNWIINQVLYQEPDTYIDSIPYLEYEALYLYNETALDMKEIHSIELEKQAREIINEFIGLSS
jgi:hypothetical protein